MPLNRVAGGDIEMCCNHPRLGHGIKPRQHDLENVSSLHIARVRCIEQRSMVWSELNVFHVEIAFSKQSCFAIVGIENVEMIASILLRAENNASAFGKLQRLSGKRRQRIIQLLA